MRGPHRCSRRRSSPCPAAAARCSGSSTSSPPPTRTPATARWGRHPTAIDAPPACAVGHDEDLDHIDDGCDLCPATPSTNADADGDGVGDECDSNPTTPGDRMLFFSTLQNTAGFDFAVAETQAPDEVHATGSGMFTSQVAFKVTRVIWGVSFGSPLPKDVIHLFAGDAGSAVTACALDDNDGACNAVGGPCFGVSVNNLTPAVVAWPQLAATVGDAARRSTAHDFTCTAFDDAGHRQEITGRPARCRAAPSARAPA